MGKPAMTKLRKAVFFHSFSPDFKELMEKEYYSIKEAAKILGVTRQTIYNWIRQGVLQVTQKMKHGAIRIHRLELPTYKREEK